MEKLSELRLKAEQELIRILDWWGYRMVDVQEGGFYGRINGTGQVVSGAPKGVILNARILWTFSAAARHYARHSFYRHLAERAKDYFLAHFVDAQSGGVFWVVDAQGHPQDTKKQIYAQAFAIYALSDYHLLTQDQEAGNLCHQLFQLIETHSRDEAQGGYLEAFDRSWGPLEDLRLSAKDLNAAKTMNTHLHLLEAYTNLFRCKPHNEVGEALYRLIHLFLDKFIGSNHHLHLFFDRSWQVQSDEISYGHDIETSWLLVEAAEVLDDQDLIKKCTAAALALAEATLPAYDEDGGLFNSATAVGVKDQAKEWWPQIEAVVGFIHAWQISSEPTYLQAALQSWSFIENKLLDRHQGEWYWGLDAQGRPDVGNDKAGLWKCPYHNSRGCLEVMRQLKQ